MKIKVEKVAVTYQIEHKSQNMYHVMPALWSALKYYSRSDERERKKCTMNGYAPEDFKELYDVGVDGGYLGKTIEGSFELVLHLRSGYGDVQGTVEKVLGRVLNA